MICVGLMSEFAIDGKIVQCWRRPVVARLAVCHHITLALSHFHGAAEVNLDLHARYATAKQHFSHFSLRVRAQPRGEEDPLTPSLCVHVSISICMFTIADRHGLVLLTFSSTTSSIME